jgi:hypothetical protein
MQVATRPLYRLNQLVQFGTDKPFRDLWGVGQVDAIRLCNNGELLYTLVNREYADGILLVDGADYWEDELSPAKGD